jgi:hypothetical protein
MRRPLAALALSLLLVACAQKERVIGGGGTAGTSGTTSSTETGTGGSTASTTGTGGGPLAAHCDPSGPQFDVLTPNDIADKLQDALVLVPDVASKMVHVAVQTGSGKTLVRSIGDNGQPRGAPVAFGDSTTGLWGLRPSDGGLANGMLTLLGSRGSGVAQVSFALDPNQGVLATPDPAYVDQPTPSDCLQGHMVRLETAFDASDPSYLVSCALSSGAASLWLYAGGNLVEIATGLEGDVTMNPKMYARVAGVSYAGFALDQGPSAFAYGPQLENVSALEIDHNFVTIAMGLAPLTTNDGVALFAASFDVAALAGSMWAGVLRGPDLPGIGSVPPPALVKIFDAPDATKVGGIERPFSGPGAIIAASPGLARKGVYFSWFDTEVKPKLVEQLVYTVVDPVKGAIQGAGAVPFGVSKMVVWIESDGTGTWVRGQQLLCGGG